MRIENANHLTLRIASVLVLGGSLSGCVEALLMPMEPSPASVAAPRRALTPQERKTISDAVLAKLNIPDAEKKNPDAVKFGLPNLVVRSHDGVTDYCGFVNKKDSSGAFVGNHWFYAKLTFNSSGKPINVDVPIIVEPKYLYPTVLDSICTQDGYL